MITYSEILNFIVSCFGYFLIFIAIDSYRPNDKIELWSKHWWINITLVVISGVIIKNVDKWFHL